MACREEQVLDLCHKHGFHERGHAWNGAVFEEDRFQLSLHVIRFLETAVIGDVRLDGRQGAEPGAVVTGETSAQLFL